MNKLIQVIEAHWPTSGHQNEASHWFDLMWTAKFDCVNGLDQKNNSHYIRANLYTPMGYGGLKCLPFYIIFRNIALWFCFVFNMKSAFTALVLLGFGMNFSIPKIMILKCDHLRLFCHFSCNFIQKKVNTIYIACQSCWRQTKEPTSWNYLFCFENSEEIFWIDIWDT